MIKTLIKTSTDFVLHFPGEYHSHIGKPNQKFHTYFLHFIPYLCGNTVSSIILKSLGRSSAVNKVCLRKVLHKATSLTKTMSRSNWPHRPISFIVEYEIANNVIHTPWIPAVSPNLKFPRLTHFSPVSHFYTPWKRHKTFGFLTFSGGIEMWHLTKMD